jgi:hypothetical protein
MALCTLLFYPLDLVSFAFLVPILNIGKNKGKQDGLRKGWRKWVCEQKINENYGGSGADSWGWGWGGV